MREGTRGGTLKIQADLRKVLHAYQQKHTQKLQNFSLTFHISPSKLKLPARFLYLFKPP